MKSNWTKLMVIVSISSILHDSSFTYTFSIQKLYSFSVDFFRWMRRDRRSFQARIINYFMPAIYHNFVSHRVNALFSLIFQLHCGAMRCESAAVLLNESMDSWRHSQTTHNSTMNLISLNSSISASSHSDVWLPFVSLWNIKTYTRQLINVSQLHRWGPSCDH